MIPKQPGTRRQGSGPAKDSSMSRSGAGDLKRWGANSLDEVKTSDISYLHALRPCICWSSIDFCCRQPARLNNLSLYCKRPLERLTHPPDCYLGRLSGEFVGLDVETTIR